jgi:amidase
MDVVVPYARTMADLLEVLDVVVADDPDTRGDLWRLQPWVPIPSRRRCARRLSGPAGRARSAQGQALRRAAHVHQQGRTGRHQRAPGIGGPTGQRIHTRAA